MSAEQTASVRPWALLCPRHCVRAEVDLEVRETEVRVLRCSLEETLARPCDRECLRTFLVGWDETAGTT